MKNVTVVHHPLIQHKLTQMRKKGTSTAKFRALLQEISLLLAYEITRDFPLTYESIETPLETMERAPVLEGKKLVLVGIMRAGEGILDGMLQIIPSARVGHVGLYRDPTTLAAVEYYCKLPRQMEGRSAIIVDPMLATGHTAIAAITRVKQSRPKNLKFVCILASRRGIQTVMEEHPDVPIFTAAVDRELDEQGYILPGIGDVGDRMFGTK